MKFACPLLAAAAALMIAAPARPAAPAGYRLAWSDEFNGSSLDTNKWIYEQPGKRRDALNTAEAVSVRDGMLTITSYTADGKHCTGFISTHRKFEPIHGYWEARIRFDDSPGEWSAFWLMTPTMGRPLGDPGQAGTEIDICEHRVVDQKGNNIADKVQHTLHWDGYRKDQHKSKGQMSRDFGIASGFHTYGLEWTTNEYVFYVDGQVSWRSTNAISHAREYCLLTCEIADKGWAGNIATNGFGSLNESRTRMAVDWVRYYTREPAGNPFEREILAFEAKDKAHFPPTNAVLFIGSSSIRLWTNVAEHFPDYPVINRGFGGSQIADSIHYADRIVFPYQPRTIVFYAGGNDINAGKSAETVFADFQTFAQKVHDQLPKTHIAYISIAPNPARWSQMERVRRANDLIEAYTRTDPRLSFINVYPQMLGPDGLPKPDIYRADRLHMNDRGYAIWKEIVGKHLREHGTRSTE